MRSTFYPTDARDETRTASYVVNHPDPRYPYTRTVETKHATGQEVLGTVVSEEYPGASARHYPVPAADHRYEQQNEVMKDLIRQRSPVPVYFCGRLANYQYIDQDIAIRQGVACAEDILVRSSAHS